MLRKFLLWTLLPLVIIFGAAYWWYQSIEFKTVESQGQVFVERLKTVAKITTVEGHFSEIYSYKDFWKYDLSPLRKQAMVRVQAKVSAGINLEGVKIETDSGKKIIRLGPIPEAELQMIDHELDYYDLSEGTFNSFDAEDHNKILQECKSLIRKAALQSDLIIQANKQLDEYLEAFRLMIEANGWNLQIIPPTPINPSFEGH